MADYFIFELGLPCFDFTLKRAKKEAPAVGPGLIGGLVWCQGRGLDAEVFFDGFDFGLGFGIDFVVVGGGGEGAANFDVEFNFGLGA